MQIQFLHSDVTKQLQSNGAASETAFDTETCQHTGTTKEQRYDQWHSHNIQATKDDLVRTTRSQWPGHCSQPYRSVLTIVSVVVRRHRCSSRLDTRQTVHHTRLYSLRFSWSIVSLTAAKTKRMFSVSADNQHMAYISHWQTDTIQSSHQSRLEPSRPIWHLLQCLHV